MTRARAGEVARDGLLAAARAGDERAYGQLVAPYRVELHAYCYRMLGSTADAEDALQEALVGAWRGLDGFQGHSSLRTWLYRIATNSCLKLIERHPRRVLPVDYGPPGDPHGERGTPVTETVWIDPYPVDQLIAAVPQAGGHDTPEVRYEQLESVELAFVAALQHLPAGQRAVLILREVLGFTGKETAQLLGTSPASVYSSLQRAHRTVDERIPQPSQLATARTLGAGEIAVTVGKFMQAWEKRDIDGLVALLTEDATFSMPPLPEWYTGHRDIAEFLSRRPLNPAMRWRVVPTRANAQPAIGHYLLDDATGAYQPHTLSVLRLRGTRIADLVAFLRADMFGAFGLPAHP